MTDDRKYDLDILRREYAGADVFQKRQIEKTAKKIMNESGAVRSMRERLIKEHRKGNVGNIKDIHEYVKNRAKYG